MGISQSNNKEPVNKYTHESIRNNISDILIKPVDKKYTYNELFNNDTLIDTLNWNGSENHKKQEVKPKEKSIFELLNLKTYFSEPNSSVTEYVIDSQKGGDCTNSSDKINNDQTGGNNTMKNKNNNEDDDDEELNTNNKLGGAPADTKSISTNFSELNRIREFIEQDIQQGGHNKSNVLKGTRPLNGGKRNKMPESSVSSSADNIVVPSSESAKPFYSESSDSQVFRGYRIR